MKTLTKLLLVAFISGIILGRGVSAREVYKPDPNILQPSFSDADSFAFGKLALCDVDYETFNPNSNRDFEMPDKEEIEKYTDIDAYLVHTGNGEITMIAVGETWCKEDGVLTSASVTIADNNELCGFYPSSIPRECSNYSPQLIGISTDSACSSGLKFATVNAYIDINNGQEENRYTFCKIFWLNIE